MSEMKRDLLHIIIHYGADNQVNMAIEEASELQKALLKFRRKPSDEARLNIIDEIADVQIMLEQLKVIYGCTAEVGERMEYKVKRQIERIKNHE